MRSCTILLLLIITDNKSICYENNIETGYKAILIEHFTRFVEWFTRNAYYPDESFVITDVGSNSTTSQLKNITKFRPIHYKKIEIKATPNFSPNNKTNIIYVPYEAYSELDKIMNVERKQIDFDSYRSCKSSNYLLKSALIVNPS